MIEEATVDCHNESEQVTGWFTMIEDKLDIYRGGMTLAQAAAAVRMPLSELFAYCVEKNIVLIQNPNFFSHMAALGRSLNLPALTAAAEALAREEQQVSVPA